MNRIFWLVIFAVLTSSCVQNRKILYLQNGEVNQKSILPKDSILRKYDLEKYNYRIQPQDILYITFSSLTPEELDFLSSSAPQSNNINLQQGGGLIVGEVVDEEGSIPLPVIGKVKLGGSTVLEAQDKLQVLASQYFEAPKAKVRLINFRITILGEVNAEGTVPIGNNRATLMEAIGLAGGLSDLADRSNLKLIRQVGDEVTVQYLDLLSEDFIASPYYYVHQNDILIVPPLRQRPYQTYFGKNLSLIISSLSLLLITITLINSTK